MWHYACSVGLPLAARVAVPSPMWLELREDARMVAEAERDG